MSTLSNVLNVSSARTQALSARAPTIEKAFRKHFRVVYETALHVTGNPSDADDAVQNTFLQWIRSNQSLDLIDNPAGYFRRAAFHQALKIVAARKRTDLTADADRFEAPAPPLADVCPGPQQQLLDFMKTLKPAAALMIKLRYIEGLGNSQIAQMLGKSEPVVAMTLFRLRKRLKKIAKGEL